jgi:hypothetical protein
VCAERGETEKEKKQKAVFLPDGLHCAFSRLQEDLNAVVMNYLITEGYAQAAAQFQEESRTAGVLLTSTA